MNQLLLFIVLIGFFIYFIYNNNNQENFATVAENVEAIKNIASLYNIDTFTETNMNCTGPVTINGVAITGSGTTLNIPNIATGVVSATGDINGSSLTTAGQMSSNTVQTNGINSAGAITASGDVTGASLNTSGQLQSNTISTSYITANGSISSNGQISSQGTLDGKCSSNWDNCKWKKG